MAKKKEEKKEEKKEKLKPITTNTTNVKKKKVILPEGFVPLKRLTKEENVIISTHNIEEIQEANRIKAEKEK